MLRLKGQTGSGEWVVFSVSDIEDADRDYTEVRLLNEDNIKYILTATIQPADDKCECPFCGKSWKPFKVEMNKEAKL